MQKKSILIIGGGEIGLNQIKIAKKIGFNVIVTDVNPSAPGLKAADCQRQPEYAVNWVV